MLRRHIAIGLIVLSPLSLAGCYESRVLDAPTDPVPYRGACSADLPDVGAPGMTTLETIDFEWENSDGTFSYRDEPFHVGIPADLVGLTLAVEDGRRVTGFRRVALEGRSLVGIEEDGLLGFTPPFFHLPQPVGSVTFPMNAVTSLDAGCLSISPFVWRAAVGESAKLHIVSRRRPSGGAMPIQVVLVGGARIADSDLDAAIAEVDRIYRGNGGPGISGFTVHTLSWPSSIIGIEGESEEVRAAFTEGREDALPIFLVQDFTEWGYLGFAGGIPGPNGASGTASSGVMVSVDGHLLADGRTLSIELLGETVAHEGAHQMGLFHTSEGFGDLHDGIEDTPECLPEHDIDGDGYLLPEECLGRGADNLMFWALTDRFPQDEMTAEQALVLNRSPYPVPAP